MKQPLLPIFCIVSLWIALPSQAQITPDATLRNPSSVRRDRNTTVITGGTQTGSSLFHSFQDFSIPKNGIASFREISPEVTNIFSRVTGGSVSRINGIIEALQSNGNLSSANFFLINPSGIHFGRNASLNMGGSFLATTANSVRFADGAVFSAIKPQDAPLLAVSVPTGLQFGVNPGGIRNESLSNPILDGSGDQIAGGLQVSPGQTLALVGGQLDILGGYITAPGGRIELGSVVGTGEVSLVNTTTGWRLSYPELAYGDIRLSQATVNATDLSNKLPGGSIQMQGNQITLNNSLMFSDTLANNQNGQDITITASQLNLENFALISTLTDADAMGNSGNIYITADRFLANSGGQVSTQTLGAGDAGNLTIRAADRIELSGENSGIIAGVFDPRLLTGLFAQTGANSTGQGGTIRLTTNRLQLQAGASINTDTSGSGRAGNAQIQAETIDLSGVFRNPRGEVVLRQGRSYPTGIFTDSNNTASGRGGEIEIRTRRLQLEDGAVLQTNAEGVGDAGNLTIRATEAVDLSGTAGAGLPPTTIFAASGGLAGVGGDSTATGRGGTLRIETPALNVRDGAVIAVGSLNPDELAEGAGNLRVQANRVQLANGGRLVAETASGNGGNIDLRVRDSISLQSNSQISTSAGVEDKGGNGGNITINTDYIFAAPTENSDIRANAFTGSGGNVTITAEGIIGIEFRERPTDFSDITVSSTFGTPGQVVIRSPDVNPSTTTADLSATPLSDRPTQGCEVARGTSTAQFFNTGRGGLSPTPYEPLSNSEILADTRLPTQIVEAQGWTVNDRGAVVLVADNPPIVRRCLLR